MKVYASIYIGSYEVSMKIFEINKDKGVKEIDCLRIQTGLIRDVLKDGKISFSSTERFCRVLSDLKRTMSSYKVDAYSVFASSFIYDASNGFFFLEQVKVRTGLTVQVISNSEQRFLGYESLASIKNFDDFISDSAILVDIGGVSLQLTLFVKGKIVTTQHILLGTVSITDNMNKISGTPKALEQIHEIMNKEVDVFRTMFLQEISPKYVIFLGDQLSSISGIGEKRVLADTYIESLGVFDREFIRQSALRNELFTDNENMIEPLVMLHRAIIECFCPKYVLSPGVSVCEGMVFEHSYKKGWLVAEHDFEKDIISAAWSIAKRYGSYQPHLKALVNLSTEIFDVMNKHHGLTSREKLLMEVIAILHDCGKYISIADASDCSYTIIMSSEILGLSHREREIIATTVAYNRRPLEPYEAMSDRFSQEDYIIIVKLLAILKVANALDRSHKQKLKNFNMTVKDSKLIIFIESSVSFALEKGLFSKNANFFEEVFSVKPVLKEKKFEN